MMAIGVLTATSLVPSGTRIFPSVPLSIASTSMVALSVSISAMTSPGFTGSPSRLSHLARLPFSIVGESAGIKTWVDIGARVVRRCWRAVAPLLHDVGIELGRIGLGVVGRELRGFVDDGAHLGIDLFQFLLGGPGLRQQPSTHLLDRIVLGADLVDLLLRPVLGRIGHRVPAIAVGEHFEDDRAVPFAAP